MPSSEHCLSSRTNCRAVSSLSPERWSSSGCPVFFPFPNLFIYQIGNTEDNSSEEVMSHETKQGSGGKYECCCSGECMYKKEFLKGL